MPRSHGTHRPGPQPENRIAPTAAEQLARVFRPRPVDPNSLAIYSDVTKLRRRLRRLERKMAHEIDSLADAVIRLERNRGR